MKPVDIVQWSLRWLVLLASFLSTFYLAATWEPTHWYVAFALTDCSIFAHALYMLYRLHRVPVAYLADCEGAYQVFPAEQMPMVRALCANPDCVFRPLYE